MAKFLNTSATTYLLEELIKNSRERLFLISPYLRFNNRIKELLEDKNRMKIDVRLVYGKSELHPEEVRWLKDLQFVRTSYCDNLHAKCYISEESCIITSLNLYEFSQINNNEMGVFISREKDGELYQDAYDEAQRLIRISDEVKISLDLVDKDDDVKNSTIHSHTKFTHFSANKLAEKYRLDKDQLNKQLCDMGYQEQKGKIFYLTEKGKEAGAKLKKGQYGWFILWPENILDE